MKIDIGNPNQSGKAGPAIFPSAKILYSFALEIHVAVMKTRIQNGGDRFRF